MKKIFNNIIFKVYVICQDFLLKNTDYLDFDYTLISPGFTDIRVGDYEHGKL